MGSNNMNYIFNVEYFKDFDTEDYKPDNTKITAFKFPEKSPYNGWSGKDDISEDQEFIPGYQEFSAYTLYPGLLVGIGSPHDIAVKGAIKMGFSFDYVTGLPYIPGSSLKGMLRAYFSRDTKDEEKNEGYEELIKELLPDECKEIDILELKKDMFEGEDIFLGAFPKPEGPLLDMDYITPHEKFKNPNPISFIKVKPGVEFVFSAIFTAFIDEESGEELLSAEEKMELCKKLILLFGIGAKTNTGYGRFSEERPIENVLLSADEKAGAAQPKQKKDATKQGKAPEITKNLQNGRL